MPRLVTIQQYPCTEIDNFWLVGECPGSDDRPAFPAIQTGWFYNTTKQGWIYLGGEFRGCQPGDEIDRGVVRVEWRPGKNDRPYKHLVLVPEEVVDDSHINVACFGRFGWHPTYHERRTRPCPSRREYSAYFASRKRPCPDCGEMFGEDGCHPNYGNYLEPWVEMGPSYQRDYLDPTQPDIEVYALRYTKYNRRYFLSLAEGSRIRIPGMPNPDETYAPDFMLSYNHGELKFELIPDEEDLEAMNMI